MQLTEAPEKNATMLELQEQLRKDLDELTARNAAKDEKINGLEQANATFETSIADLKKRYADTKEMRMQNELLKKELQERKLASEINDTLSNHSLKLDTGIVDSPEVAGRAGRTATEPESAGGSMGFVASNTTSPNEVTGLTTDSMAATESVDTSRARSLLGNVPGLYGLVALILALLCSAFAWSIRS